MSKVIIADSSIGFHRAAAAAFRTDDGTAGSFYSHAGVHTNSVFVRGGYTAAALFYVAFIKQ